MRNGWLVALLGCGQDDAVDRPAPSDACASAPTWDAFAEPFLVTWCRSCHSSALEDPFRGGAPEGVDFDTYADVLVWAAAIEAAATGPSPTMPVGGGPTDEERADLAEWLACGLPEAPEPVDVPCDRPLADGDQELASAADLDLFCASFSGTTGDLTVRLSDTVGCVCSVGGDLVVAPGDGEVELPSLLTVGGAVALSDTAASAFGAPTLASAGSVRLARNPALQSLDLPLLARVDGDVLLEDDGVGGDVALDGLVTVGGSVRATGLPRLTSLTLLRLTTLGGSQEVSDAGAVTLDLGPLRQIPGDLRLAGLPALTAVDGLTLLDTVGGDLSLDGLGLAAEPRLPALLAVSGALEICDNPAAPGVDFLQLAEIGGTLRLCRNAAFAQLGGLAAVTHIGGDLEITDNPALPTALAVAFADGPTIDGAVTIEGNR